MLEFYSVRNGDKLAKSAKRLEMQGNSKAVISNQNTIHPDLREIASKHMGNPYMAPLHQFSLQVFEHIKERIAEHGGPLILDSGCGTGESTVKLARLYPDALVIGVDKSLDRINETPFDNRRNSGESYLIVRGDLIDLWRQFSAAGIRLQHHFFLYPNPWPKKKHVMRRWHGHPVFPHVLALGGTIHLRTNWEIYAREFDYVLRTIGKAESAVSTFSTKNHISPFERKYAQSGHPLFEVIAELPDAEHLTPAEIFASSH